MAISTLNEYYQSKGQALPSLSERQGIAAQAGIQNYTGSAQQNTQLLGNLMSNGSNNQVSVPSTPIPAIVATGSTQQLNLPNKPQPQEPANVYSNASAYVSALPKTGVAGLDQTIQAMTDRPGQLAREYDIANKQSLMNEAKFKLDSFNEQYRVQQERIRTEGGRSLEQINSEVNAIERTRAFTAGTLAIEAAYRTGDFQGAKELMNQQVALELEPMKMKYQFFKDMYERTEDQKFQRAMKAEDRAYQAAQKAGDRLNDLKMEALKQGASWDDVNRIKSLADFANISKTPLKIAQKTFDIKEKISGIDEMLSNNAGIRGSAGPTILQRGGILTVVPRGKLNADVQQLISQTTLDNLINAKAKGATFGALSEGELKLLSASGSKLATWAITDKNGNITGFKASERQVRDELAKIKSYAVRDYEITTGQPYTTENDPAGLGIDIIQYDPAGLFN